MLNMDFQMHQENEFRILLLFYLMLLEFCMKQIYFLQSKLIELVLQNLELIFYNC